MSIKNKIKILKKKILNDKLGNFYNLIYKKKNYKKKIESINLSLKDSEKKIILLAELLNKSPKDGIIVECGVGNGFSLTVISNLSKKKIYAFDSFEGFPDKISKNDVSESDTVDLNNVLKFSKFHYKNMSEDLVKQNLIKNGIKSEYIQNNIKMIKGFFPKSFEGFNEKISFLHLDVDLYNSYKDCLNFFYPMVVKGGIITFDEYVDRNINVPKKGWGWHGAKIAIDEFVKDNNLNLLSHPMGYKYVIKN